ncbi:unnamed protein product (macronuclear) [Paramecium tetraurelia]|uniref:Uncharacterized protein n=1 Tax=Paramecium tetraurelia TaxID=5888 RepID=A0BB52_PARTE|nr:uncharacterized protein GSPATT00000204001 [Paramecium tetraurelia]CAK55769.1 unnamed protein product [Paramecium tetraurelia]|eukprot:XP_001423167.1 hypothetical protein (macronuclear) [Paramecium tetraurelia strain d4-2]
MFRKPRQIETHSLHYSISQSEIKRSSYFTNLSHRYRSQSIDLSNQKIKQPILQIKSKSKPRMQINPIKFQIFKSNKPLTEFKEFKLRTADRCKSREKLRIREQNKENKENIYIQYNTKL